MQGIDRGLFHVVNNLPEAIAPVMWFFSKATDLLVVRFLLAAMFIYCLWRPALRRPGISAVLGFLVANTLCDILKRTFEAGRPSVELADAIVRVDGGRGFGTASAHSANMAAVCVAFWRCGPWGRAIGLTVAAMTGLSRIYNGVHYPSQVLLGWTVGALVGLSIEFVWKRVEARGAQTGVVSDEGKVPLD